MEYLLIFPGIPILLVIIISIIVNICNRDNPREVDLEKLELENLERNIDSCQRELISVSKSLDRCERELQRDPSSIKYQQLVEHWQKMETQCYAKIEANKAQLQIEQIKALKDLK